ncbi:MAG: phosphopentomutase [Clostridia bacterium]|nr:phosphopentomutase [Clostridia bacterium]
MKRVFLIVLDSVGIGALPDAQDFGDTGCNTLLSCAKTGLLQIPNLCKMGLGCIDGVTYLPQTDTPTAVYARMQERSRGKDTTIGHWEIAGLISQRPLPTYPEGFPEDLLKEIYSATGRGYLCNKPYSGTEVIKDYGQEHLDTGKLIIYTSADSVLQIAAHEDYVPPKQLYAYCEAARAICQGPHGVGRVIARPFTGTAPNFVRTPNRRDFSLEPPGRTMLDAISEAGLDVISVGKIQDIFTGRGITKAVEAHGNQEAMEATGRLLQEDFNGLAFINLVDFDMLYGHRNDAVAYTKALNEFDGWLSTILPELKQDDLLMITADHGCDPTFPGTDHTREYTPLLVYGKGITPENAGTRNSFAQIAATVCKYLDVPFRRDYPCVCTI